MLLRTRAVVWRDSTILALTLRSVTAGHASRRMAAHVIYVKNIIYAGGVI
jgi:hypothetical protein